MNYYQVVGYYVGKPERLANSTVSEYSEILVNVRSNMMQQDGQYQFDTFRVALWKGLSNEILDAVPLNTLIGIKGRIELVDDGVRLIAEQVEHYNDFK